MICCVNAKYFGIESLRICQKSLLRNWLKWNFLVSRRSHYVFWCDSSRFFQYSTTDLIFKWFWLSKQSQKRISIKISTYSNTQSYRAQQIHFKWSLIPIICLKSLLLSFPLHKGNIFIYKYFYYSSH